MRIDIVTPFPDLIEGFFCNSMLKRAQDKEVVSIYLWNLREFAEDKHSTIDDYPYGGGAGMIMKPEPIFRAVDRIKEEAPQYSKKIIFLTPQGEKYTQKKARLMSLEPHLIFLCGHYRGIDERVVESLVTDEISIGDYILTGGELPTACIVDSVVRLLPGVLSDFDSAEGDSFSSDRLDHPHYTRPSEFRGMDVPDVLLSGHHEKVEEWRKKKAIERTQKRRPDLLNSNINSHKKLKNK